MESIFTQKNFLTSYIVWKDSILNQKLTVVNTPNADQEIFTRKKIYVY